MINYRSLNATEDWCFFFEDCAIPPENLVQIKPLTEESAQNLWRQYVSPHPNFDHPALLLQESWPQKLRSSPTYAEWKYDWNDDTSTDFQDWLIRNLPNTSLIFQWSSCDAVQTSTEIFICHWRNFLFSDEGPFVWSLQQPQAIRFMPNGVAYAGFRCSMES